MDHLNGTLMRYPWGTTDAIPTLLGMPADGGPVAEYWLGAHPLSPSHVGETSLNKAIAADPGRLGPEAVSAFGPTLPFLMKVLSARHALSLQAHPSRTQAREGFEAEEERGISRTASERTYRDDWPKPEILIALSEFDTLLGFRDPKVTSRLFHGLGVGADVQRLVAPLDARGGVAALQEVFLDVLSIGDDRRAMVTDVLRAASQHQDSDGAVGELARTAVEIEADFGADPGVIAAMLMNRVTLGPGEGVYVPTGVMHAHLRGTGVEVMASSDNVLRGGLTNKHIAVDELVRVVDFAWITPFILKGIETVPGLFSYPTECQEFDVWRLEVDPDGSVDLPADGSARIALVTEGQAVFRRGGSHLTCSRGESLFFDAADAGVEVEGDAQVFVSAPGQRRPGAPG
ncbi:MAG: mannose-6-phosphate isomerase, class I [Propioniciclava sp.]